MLKVNQLSGFGARRISGGGGGGGGGDPNFGNVVLLLGFEGSTGATSGPGFTDESTASPKGTGVITAAGPSLSSSHFRYGATSLSVSGGAGSGGFAWPDHSDFNLGTSLFTIEASFRPRTVAAGVYVICGQWATGGNQGWVLAQSGASLIFRVSTSGSDSFTLASGGTVFIQDTWHDVAVDFDGTTYRLYVGGGLVGSSTTLRIIANSSTPLTIGHSYSGGTNVEIVYGFIDELRITKNVARRAVAFPYTPGPFPRS